MADAILVRKSRVIILIGAQTKDQFHLIYGMEGTQALFTGLASQIVCGGCNHDTAHAELHWTSAQNCVDKT